MRWAKSRRRSKRCHAMQKRTYDRRATAEPSKRVRSPLTAQKGSTLPVIRCHKAARRATPLCLLICLFEQVHAAWYLPVYHNSITLCHETVRISEGSGSPETVKPLSSSTLDTKTTQGPEHKICGYEREHLRKKPIELSACGLGLREAWSGCLCPAVRQDLTTMRLMPILRE